MTVIMSVDRPKLDLSAVTPFAIGLDRPECVRLGHDGKLYASDGRGGVCRIQPNGSTELILAERIPELSEPLIPNGICPQPDGSVLLAHLGQKEGGVFRLCPDRSLIPHLRAVDGIELPPTNYVSHDRQGRLWVTVSTKLVPRALDYRKSASSGFIALVDGRGARIVADGLRYTNECLVSPDGGWLYVNETFAKRTIRFPVKANGDLGAVTTVAEYGAGEFPDGMAFDAAGGLWIACIFGNTLLRVTPDGSVERWLSAPDEGLVAHIERAFASDALTAADMGSAGTSPLGNISSVEFAGPSMDTIFLGSLQSSTLFRLQAPTAGFPRAAGARLSRF